MVGGTASGAFFNNTDLSGARLDTLVDGAPFYEANLSNANLLGSDWQYAGDGSWAYYCNTTMSDGSINNANCGQPLP